MPKKKARGRGRSSSPSPRAAGSLKVGRGVIYRERRGGHLVPGVITRVVDPKTADLSIFHPPAVGDAVQRLAGCPRHVGPGEPAEGTWK